MMLESSLLILITTKVRALLSLFSDKEGERSQFVAQVDITCKSQCQDLNPRLPLPCHVSRELDALSHRTHGLRSQESCKLLSCPPHPPSLWGLRYGLAGFRIARAEMIVGNVDRRVLGGVHLLRLK